MGLLRFQLDDRCPASAKAMPWALGFTRDGYREVLGAWRPLSTDYETGEHVAGDLRARGVERVCVISSCAGEEITVGLLRAFPRAKLVQLPQQAQSMCLPSTHPRRRRDLSEASGCAGKAASPEASVDALVVVERDTRSSDAWDWHPALAEGRALLTTTRRAGLDALRANESVRQIQERAATALLQRSFECADAAAEFAEARLVAAERRLRSGGSARAAGQSSADVLRRPTEAGAHR